MTGFDLGGGGGNSFSFGPQGSQPGASVTGTVLDMKEVQETNYDTKEPEFWPNGDPKMQFRLTLQTDLRNPDNPGDDGKRDVYLSGYRKAHPKTGTSGTLYAVLEAVRVATGSTQLKYGGKLTLQWVSGMGFTGDPRHYQAWYEAPAMELQQPVEHRSPAPPPAAPQIGSQAANPGPPPAWAQTQPVPTAAPTPAPVPAAAPAPVAQAPAATPQAAPAQAAWGTPPAPATAVTGTDQWSRPLTAAEVAAARNAGIDPAAVYGADYEQRITA